MRTLRRPFHGHVARSRALSGLSTALLALLSNATLGAVTDLPIAGASGKTLQVPWEQIEPDQLLVLVNTADQQSVDVASEYMSKYHIPSANRLRVSFPKVEVMGSNDFADLYDTVQSFLSNKPNLQAIAVTWTEPWKVSPPDMTAGMSITSALTFGFSGQYYNTHGSGCYVTKNSPLYGQDLSAPYSDFGLRPAMVLAGDTTQDAIDVIDRSFGAKSTFPLPTGYLVRTTDEDRSVRYQQMEEASESWTSAFGLQIVYRDNSTGPESDDYIRNSDDVLYYFTGIKEVDYLDTLQFVPGAVADHLTSTGGALTDTGQMSILEWLKAGASGSYGTVAEPCNFTEKFTNISMFLDRYFSGVPLIDAYWYAVKEPGEGIFVGDPMAQPYATKARLNGAGQIELTTTALLPMHIYKVTGVDGSGAVTMLLTGVHVDTPDVRVLEVPAGFASYRLIDTGTLYDDHGAPKLNASSITELHLPGGVAQFDIRADDPQNSQVFYSVQLANGKMLSQNDDFSARVLLEGDVNGDGYVNFGDVGVVKGAMYAQKGDADYLPDADVDNDGSINFSDLGLIKGNFGTTRSFVRISSSTDGTKNLVIMAFDKYGSQSQMTVKVGAGELVIVDP